MTDEHAEISRIKIDLVRLVYCHFEVNEAYTTAPARLNVPFGFDFRRTFISPRELSLVASISVFEDISEAPFELSVAFELRCSVAKDALADSLRRFGKYNAPGLLIPYLREVVSNVSVRSGFAPLILPPINVQALIDSLEDSAEEPRGISAQAGKALKG